MGRKVGNRTPNYRRPRKPKVSTPSTIGMSDLLWQLGKRDAWICWICRDEVFVHENNPMLRPSKDHLIPASLGGPSGLWNLRLAHFGCNAKRDASPIPPPSNELLKYITVRTYPILLERFRRAYGHAFTAHKESIWTTGVADDGEGGTPSQAAS